MNRRDIAFALLALSAAPLAAFGQPAEKMFRIGFLAGGGTPPDNSAPAPLRQAMRELGYVEGKTVAYVGRWANAKPERLPGLAAELIALKVDAIVALGAPVNAAARTATATIPIVMAGPSGDAVATGMVTSLARPGGNVTGLSDDAGPLSAKRIQILKEAVPKARRIAILWNSDDQAMTIRYNEIDKAARMLQVAVQPFGLRDPGDFSAAFDAMKHERPDALFLVADSLTFENRKRVADFAEQQRIPTMYEFGAWIRGGGLLAYGPSAEDSYRVVARFIDRILKGAKPADLPVEQPTRYYLAINLKTAAALNLTMPQALLVRADEVIQ